ncbi:hypothetical protein GpartN1_g3754.t1 [Galdieria partita]|uniref:Uncharacterized protein n=1 Tax=Galdieria partita TaxID=83374 RepID=A0A9C7UQI7_9RHOD|nr:hypothetical protein GpartN1_g3754.t1 [Galdieria partita]
MSKMSLSFILNPNKENQSTQLTLPSLSQFMASSHFSEPVEFSRHENMIARSQLETLRIFSAPRLLETGMIDNDFEETRSSSRQFSHCASRKNRRLKYVRMIEEETTEEGRLQQRLIWLIRRIGMQKVSQVLNEQLPDSFPVIEGSAKDTVILERPRREGGSRSGTPLSEEQRASRRNMQKRESKRRLFKYFQDQLDAIRQNIRKLREATRICEILFDQMIESNIHRLTQSGQDMKKDFPRNELLAESPSTPSSRIAIQSEGNSEGAVQQNYTAHWEQ